MADVANEICDKLIHRHPHIYGDVVVADEEEVKQNWEKLKLLGTPSKTDFLPSLSLSFSQFCFTSSSSATTTSP